MLEKEFMEYHNIYERILSNFYPSLNSTGFQERNLTVNFSKAYEKINSDKNIVSWFEFQFGEKRKEHIDCIIINETNKEIYLIESKRFVSPRKTDEIIKDIKRIKQIINDDNTYKERVKNIDSYHKRYGIILADVWIENTQKREIFEKFKDEKFFSAKEFNELDLYKNDFNYFTHEFDNGEYFRKSIKDEYALLSFVWEIK